MNLKQTEIKNELPRHIAVIMDGNGRWAKKRGLPRTAGHRKGADVFAKIVQYCSKLGISYVTAYAFSTENWKRPQEEIDAIMDLLKDYLIKLEEKREENGRLRFLGDMAPLPIALQERMRRIERETADKTGICVNIALNYGGRDEIVHAARDLAARCVAGTLTPDEIDETLFSDALYTSGLPDPDFIIRPSGENRTSNFLPWQAAYAELIFLDVLWPDFTEKDLDTALQIYQSRSRRFGGI